jgi:ribosomal protein S27AE
MSYYEDPRAVVKEWEELRRVPCPECGLALSATHTLTADGYGTVTAEWQCSVCGSENVLAVHIPETE